MTTPGNLKGTTVGLRAFEDRTLRQMGVSINRSPTMIYKIHTGVDRNARMYTRTAYCRCVHSRADRFDL